MAINPSDFQAQATAWITAVVGVAVVLAAAVAKIVGLAAEVKGLTKTADNHTADIRSVNEQITAVAQQVPPAPVQPPVVDKSGNVSS